MKYHGQFFTALICSLFLLLGLANQASARLETLSWDAAGDESIIGFRIYKRTATGNFTLDREVQIERDNLGLNTEGWFLPSYQVDDLEIQIVALSAFNSAGESTLSNQRMFNDDDADGYPNAIDSAPNDPSLPSSEPDPGTEPPPDSGGSSTVAALLPAPLREVLDLRAGTAPAVWRRGRRLEPGDDVEDGDVLDLVTVISGG